MNGYEVWDTRTVNLVASFGHRRDVEQFMADVYNAHGADEWRALAIITCRRRPGPLSRLARWLGRFVEGER